MCISQPCTFSVLWQPDTFFGDVRYCFSSLTQLKIQSMEKRNLQIWIGNSDSTIDVACVRERREGSGGRRRCAGNTWGWKLSLRRRHSPESKREASAGTGSAPHPPWNAAGAGRLDFRKDKACWKSREKGHRKMGLALESSGRQGMPGKVGEEQQGQGQLGGFA